MFHTQRHTEGIILTSHNMRAEIFTFGALLNRFEIRLPDGRIHSLIDAFDNPHHAETHITRGFHSAKLSPFACRLKQGRYHFNRQHYQINKYLTDNHALHGLIYDARFHMESAGNSPTCAWVKLSHHYPGTFNGYPFPYRIQIHYYLLTDGLQIITSVRNTGSQTLPIADGWHPYFRLDHPLDQCTLQLAARHKLQFDSQLLPTGQIEHDLSFLSPRRLAGLKLDNSYILTRQRPAAILSSPTLQLEIDAEANYPFLQIYIPPERTAIAIENLSGAPDCFNNHLGLRILRPGQTQHFSLRYRPGIPKRPSAAEKSSLPPLQNATL